MKILLGLTGSVASVLYLKLIEELRDMLPNLEVEVILTDKAFSFVNHAELNMITRPKGWNGEPVQTVWTDKNEWSWKRLENSHEGYTDISNKWRKNDRVLHIELRNQASALVIAPCSANTLAKITNGICDNLLTSVARSWDKNRPFIIAPAMNTYMWDNPITKKQLSEFVSLTRNRVVVNPQRKMLACNTEGMGALAQISDIVKSVKESLQWEFPLHDAWCTIPKCNGIPGYNHPGAYLTKRKHHTHTGVDLYTEDGQFIHAVEDGTVVGVEDFTGKSQNTPWWEDTKCILIEGASGVICYGEMMPSYNINVGQHIVRDQFIGRVKRVLPLNKTRPDIDGHSISMLHMEVYKHGVYRSFEENPELGPLSDWNDLIDPTPFLMNSRNRPNKVLKA